MVVRVADDGRGGADPAHGSGLRGLADRVEALGGGLSISSPVGAGTLVVAELPLTGDLVKPLRARPSAWVAVAAVALVGWITVAIVRAEPGLSLAGDSAAALVAEVLAAGLLTGAAIATWRGGGIFPCSSLPRRWPGWSPSGTRRPPAQRSRPGCSCTPRGRRCWPRPPLRGLDEQRLDRPPPYCWPSPFGTWRRGAGPRVSRRRSTPLRRTAPPAPPTCSSSRTPRPLDSSWAGSVSALTAVWDGGVRTAGPRRTVLRLTRSATVVGARCWCRRSPPLLLFGVDAVHGLEARVRLQRRDRPSPAPRRGRRTRAGRSRRGAGTAASPRGPGPRSRGSCSTSAPRRRRGKPTRLAGRRTR